MHWKHYKTSGWLIYAQNILAPAHLDVDKLTELDRFELCTTAGSPITLSTEGLHLPNANQSCRIQQEKRTYKTTNDWAELPVLIGAMRILVSYLRPVMYQDIATTSSDFPQLGWPTRSQGNNIGGSSIPRKDARRYRGILARIINSTEHLPNHSAIRWMVSTETFAFVFRVRDQEP